MLVFVPLFLGALGVWPWPQSYMLGLAHDFSVRRLPVDKRTLRPMLLSSGKVGATAGAFRSATRLWWAWKSDPHVSSLRVAGAGSLYPEFNILR